MPPRGNYLTKGRCAQFSSRYLEIFVTRPPWATPSHKRPSSLDILSGHLTAGWIVLAYTVAPRYNKGRRDWQNLFAITSFRYIEALFHIFFYYWGRKRKSFVISRMSLYRGSLYRGSTVSQKRNIHLSHNRTTHKRYPMTIQLAEMPAFCSLLGTNEPMNSRV